MALKDVFKVNRKTFFNPSAWLDYDRVKRETKTVRDLFKIVFTSTEPVYKETFQEAKKRLGLTEEDIVEAEKNYFFYAMLFLISGLCVAAMSFYLVFTGHFLDFLLGEAVAAVILAQAFKNHFWYFQIKHRKLGCTFEEWRNGRPKEGGE